jgi:hypothetical protein
MDNLIFEKRVLKLSMEDRSCIFIKPDSDEYKGKALVVYQDAYGKIDCYIDSEEVMKKYLTYDQWKQVMEWLNKPKWIFKG